MNEIAVIVPAMRRPQNVAPLMRSLEASTDRATAYFVCDHGDTDQIKAVLDTDAQFVINWSSSTTFATKCNLGYRETEEPWLLFVGDDVHFHPGWVEAALAAGEYGAFVSTNDMGNPRVMAGRHATHPMVARWWLDQHGATWDGPGAVCHQGYRHWYVDNEWTAVALNAGQFVYAEDAKIEHMHPVWDKGDSDEIYTLGQASAHADSRLFRERLGRYAS
jgi:hypothetical protein